ncbi:Solute carrier 38 member [Perkinsus olseni]|uniref:Solute carrier 38 member n=1 Tax=Perkinsus olseni TaxID=32597 RepID=A0A7J6KWF8_PEROL|nr:Solute carrier 38 member [Perkinsus olseni]
MPELPKTLYDSGDDTVSVDDLVISRTCTPASDLGLHASPVKGMASGSYLDTKEELVKEDDPQPGSSEGFLSPGSAGTATIAVIKATLGAAALSSTFAMVNGGFIFGILLLIMMAILMVYSLEMIVTAIEVSGKTSYAELVPYLFGNAVGYWFQAPIMIFCVGAGSGYLITVTDILSSLFAAVVESDTWYGNLLTKRVYLSLLVLAVVLYPISLVRRMSSLRYLTLVSIFGIFYLGFVGVFLLATEGLSPDFTTNDITFYAPTGWVSCLGAANTFIFAFCNQCNIPDIYMEMSDRSPRKFRIVAAWASSVCLVVYLLISICFTLVYGSEVQSSIILNMNKFIPEGNVVVIIGLVLSAVAYIGTYPFTVYPVRVAVVTILRPKRPELVGVVTVTVVVLLTYIIAACLPDISIILGVVGAISGSILCFLAPGGFNIAVSKSKRLLAPENAKRTGIFIFGCFTLVVGTSDCASFLWFED